MNRYSRSSEVKAVRWTAGMAARRTANAQRRMMRIPLPFILRRTLVQSALLPMSWRKCIPSKPMHSTAS